MSAPELDPDVITREILTALRGTQAQLHLSRRLGYSFNQVYRWESGQTRLPWRMYLRLAKLKNIDVKAALWWLIDYRGTAEDTAAITKALVRDLPLADAAQKTGHSRFQLGRWLGGQNEPSLRCVVAMVLSLSSRYLEVLAAMAPGKLPSLVPIMTRREKQLAVTHEMPFATELVSWLQMRRYAASTEPSDLWLAARLGLEVGLVRRALTALTEAEVIKVNPTDAGKYQFSGIGNLASGGDRGRFIHIVAYWFERTAQAVRRIRSSRHKSAFAYLSLPVTAESKQAIVKKAATFFEEVKRIAAESPLTEANEVLMLNFALLSTDENPDAFVADPNDPFFRP